MSNPIKVDPIDVSIASIEDTKSVAILGEASGLAAHIISQESYEIAADLRTKVRARLKWLEDTRKSITQPLDQAKKAVMDLFRKPTEKYEQALNVIDKAMIAYDEAEEKKRLAEEERLRKEAEKKKADLEKKAEEARASGKEDKADKYEEKAANIVTPTLAPTAEKPKGIQYRDHWTAEVVNFEKLPNDYKIANMPMLNKVAQATKGTLQIPGVVFKKEKIVASRTTQG